MEAAKRIALHCLVFGRYHTSCFERFLLPSVFHGGVTRHVERGRWDLLISTKKESISDIQRVIDTSGLSQMVNVVTQVLDSDQSAPIGNLESMGKAHLWAVEQMISSGAYGSFLSPDMIASANYLELLLKSAQRTELALLAPALRTTYMESVRNLVGRGNERFGVLAGNGLSPRAVASLYLDSLHEETASFLFDGDYLRYQHGTTPTAAIFKHKTDDRQLMGFSLSWFILGLNFAKIPLRNLEAARVALRNHTIDAHFLSKCLEGNHASVRVIQNSDEFCAASWDKERVSIHSSQPPPWPIKSSQDKINLIRIGLHGGLYDNFKLRHYSTPWVLNSGTNATDLNPTSYSIPTEFQTLLSPELGRSRRVSLISTVRAYLDFRRDFRRNGSSSKSRARPHGLLKRLLLKGSVAQWVLKQKIISLSLRTRCLFLKWSRKLSHLLCVGMEYVSWLVTFNRVLGNPLNQGNGNRIQAMGRIIIQSKVNSLILLREEHLADSPQIAAKEFD